MHILETTIHRIIVLLRQMQRPDACFGDYHSQDDCQQDNLDNVLHVLVTTIQE